MSDTAPLRLPAHARCSAPARRRGRQARCRCPIDGDFIGGQIRNPRRSRRRIAPRIDRWMGLVVRGAVASRLARPPAAHQFGTDPLAPAGSRPISTVRPGPLAGGEDGGHFVFDPRRRSIASDTSYSTHEDDASRATLRIRPAKTKHRERHFVFDPRRRNIASVAPIDGRRILPTIR
jgi:hypothetical protein